MPAGLADSHLEEVGKAFPENRPQLQPPPVGSRLGPMPWSLERSLCQMFRRRRARRRWKGLRREAK